MQFEADRRYIIVTEPLNTFKHLRISHVRECASHIKPASGVTRGEGMPQLDSRRSADRSPGDVRTRVRGPTKRFLV